MASTQPLTPSWQGKNLALKCSCDLTVRGCDANCCCDPDCTTAQKAGFAECKATTNQTDTAKACITTQHLSPYVATNSGKTQIALAINIVGALVLLYLALTGPLPGASAVGAVAALAAASCIAWHSPDVRFEEQGSATCGLLDNTATLSKYWAVNALPTSAPSVWTKFETARARSTRVQRDQGNRLGLG